MEKDVLIVEENLMDNYEQDLKGMEGTLKTLDMDTTPKPLELKYQHKTCTCGNTVFESPKGQFRCGHCGNILYKKGGLKDGIL